MTHMIPQAQNRPSKAGHTIDIYSTPLYHRSPAHESLSPC
jgi:hypothetical protein